MTMRKHGFTLAEILITLGIVGIVAAITLPGLNNSINSRKVGPALAKAINNLENANRTALVKQNRRTIEDLEQTHSKEGLGTSNNVSYLNRIARYMQGELVMTDASVSNAIFKSKDGVTYKMHSSSGATYPCKNNVANCSLHESPIRADLPRSKYEGSYYDVMIDVNGEGQPNLVGEDKFLVHVDNFGIVIPAGGLEAAEYLGVPSALKDCTDPDEVINEYCTGTIADSSWEVRY